MLASRCRRRLRSGLGISGDAGPRIRYAGIRVAARDRFPDRGKGDEMPLRSNAITQPVRSTREVASKFFAESGNLFRMASWAFLTVHARVLPCVAHDPAGEVLALLAGAGAT